MIFNGDFQIVFSFIVNDRAGISCDTDYDYDYVFHDWVFHDWVFHDWVFHCSRVSQNSVVDCLDEEVVLNH